MFRLTTSVLLAASLIACAQVSPLESGTGGSGGNGGGGLGGDAGGGGSSGGGGVGGSDPCAVVAVEGYANLEAGDVVQQGIGIGEVEGACPGFPCEGTDPIDRWAITTCGGNHEIALTWDDSNSNLDLFVSTSDDSNTWSSQGNDTMSESVVIDLQAGAQYIIQVQAVDTLGVAKNYNVTARPVE